MTDEFKADPQADLDDDTPPWQRQAEPARPAVGTSDLAKGLEEKGVFDALKARHEAQRDDAQQKAVEDSQGFSFDSLRKSAHRALTEMEERLPSGMAGGIAALKAFTTPPDKEGMLGPDLGMLKTEEERKAAAKSELDTREWSAPLARKVASSLPEDFTHAASEKRVAEGRADVEAGRTVEGYAKIAAEYSPIAWITRFAKGSLDSVADKQEKALAAAQSMARGEIALPEKSWWRDKVESGAATIANFSTATMIQYMGIASAYLANMHPGMHEVDPWDNNVTKFGRDLEKYVEKLFPGDKTRQYEFSKTAVQGIGSAITFGLQGKALGAVLGGGPMAVDAAIALAGAAAQTPEEFGKVTEALKKGDATERDRLIVLLANSALGATEVFGIAPTIAGRGRLGARSAAQRGLEQFVEEGAQEIGQQYGQNLTAKYTYNPSQDPYEGVAEGGLVGMLTGGIFGAAYSQAKGRAEAEEGIAKARALGFPGNSGNKEPDDRTRDKRIREAKVRSGTKTDVEPTPELPSDASKPEQAPGAKFALPPLEAMPKGAEGAAMPPPLPQVIEPQVTRQGPPPLPEEEPIIPSVAAMAMPRGPSAAEGVRPEDVDTYMRTYRGPVSDPEQRRIAERELSALDRYANAREMDWFFDKGDIVLRDRNGDEFRNLPNQKETFAETVSDIKEGTRRLDQMLQEMGADIGRRERPSSAKGLFAEPRQAAPKEGPLAEAEVWPQFQELIAGKTPASQWASAMGLTNQQLKPLLKRAVKQGLLRQTASGQYRRTTQKPKVAAAPAPAIAPLAQQAEQTAQSLAIPSDMRLARAIELIERQRGKPVSRFVRNAATRIEQVLGKPEFDASFEKLKKAKGLTKDAALDLGRIVGYGAEPKTKAQALKAIAARHTAELANAQSGDVRKSARVVPEGSIPGEVSSDEGVGATGQTPEAGGPGSGRDVVDAAGGNDQQPGPAGGLLGAPEGAERGAGADTRDGQSRPDTPAPVKPYEPTEEDFERIREDAAKKAAELAKAREARAESNYRITDADMVGKGGPKAKVRANLEALRVLKAMEDEGRTVATPEEKAKLVKFVGWGAFAQDLFATYKSEWAKERAELQNLLTPEEYASAQRSTTNAHYTSPDVVRGMWKALEHLGFKGGRAVEPSAGIGHFIGLQPEESASETDWTAVELDTVSGRITKALYGAADVRIGGFEEQKWPKDHFDLAISNVPFGDYKVHDPAYNKLNLLIHDYFFVKSLDLVRPGGIVAFITSSGTLDKVRDTARREIEKRGTFLGAIRLPGGSQGAFKANAGTDVTTDIIFVRKRMEGEPTDFNAEWQNLEAIKTPEGSTKINAYFAKHPEMMLGKMRLIGSMYRDNSPVLIGPSTDLDTKIAEAAEKGLPENAMLERGGVAEAVQDEIDTDVGRIKEGAFYDKDGKLFRKVVGVGVPQKLNKSDEARVRAFLPIRDTVTKMLANQATGSRESMDELRMELDAAYDAFVEEHGPINLTFTTEQKRKDGKIIKIKRKPNLRAFEEDPDAYSVASIEVYDEKTNTARKAAIFTEDIVAPYVRPEIAGPADALAVSLNETGNVDLARIAEMLKTSEERAAEALGDSIYKNPRGEKWQTAAKYLSGDVVAKLEEAKIAAALDGGAQYQRNVAALEAVQPKPLSRAEITVPFGASWVPAEVINQFLSDRVGLRDTKVDLNPMTKQWRIASQGGHSQAAQAEWGTKRKTYAEIIEAALNSGVITVYDKQKDGKAIRNEKEESEARAKVDMMREAFTGQIFPGAPAAIGGWVWQDETRAAELEALYNASFNRIVKEQFDGSHLTFPGLARVVSFPDGTTGQINLTPARTGAIWRIIQNGNTLIDHVVGAGKTWTSIMAVMEMKRLGQIRRPMFVVPNHMLHQFSSEFLQAYPNAKLLVATKDSMSAEKRREFAAKAAAEKWDGIIITHSAFGRLRMNEAAYKDYYQEAIDQLENAKRAAAIEGGKDDVRVKDLQKAKNRLLAKLEKLTTKESKDYGVSFEELGVDHLTVDEAHCFPHDTQIATNLGYLPIGRIVNERLPVNVLSYDHATGATVWRPVTQFWRHDRADKQFVRITLDSADILCTTNHQVYVEGRGYVRADSVKPGEVMRALRQDVRAQVERGGRSQAEALLKAVREDADQEARHQELRAVRRAVHLQELGTPEQRQAGVLLERLCRKLAHAEARSGGEISARHARGNAGEVGDGYRVSHTSFGDFIGAYADTQSHEIGRSERENPRLPARSHLFGAWRQQHDHKAAIALARVDGLADRASNSDSARARSVSKFAELLQGGFGGSATEAGNRGGWQLPPAEEVEVSGREEDGRSVRARVVGVEVLERGSAGEPGKDRAEDQFVYDIGVEGEHNYFAGSVLVHNSFKNLWFPTRHTRVKGISNSSESQRATDLYIKIRHLEKMRPGRSTLFLTGTPLSNTMAEVYTMMRYLQHDTLAEYGIAEFDSWAQTFGEIKTESKLAPNGRDFKDTTSFGNFVNIPELSTLYGRIADTQTAESLNLPRPKLKGGKAQVVEVELSDSEEAFVQALIDEMERIKGTKDGAKKFLPLFTQGLQVGTDMRLVDPDAPANPNGKIARTIDNVARIWEEGNADPAAPNKAQLIFLDMGVPGSKAKAKTATVSGNVSAAETEQDVLIEEIRKKLADDQAVDEDGEPAEIKDEDDALAEAMLQGKFNLYEDIKQGLIAKGVPASEIAFIHDAKTDDAKAKLFSAVRDGKVRVLIGTSSKMGVGTNVQKRLVALHHVDAPWKPADVEQRDGRILRQGNMNPEVQVFRYITKRSFDSYRWQILENKSHFIGQFRAGARGVRIAEDIDAPLPDAAELKAAATGDPRIVEHAELSRQVRVLEAQASAHAGSAVRARQMLGSTKASIERNREFLKAYEADAAKVQDLSGENFKVELDLGGRKQEHVERKAAGEMLKKAMLVMAERAGYYGGTRFTAGTMSGFTMKGFLRRTPDAIEVEAAIEGGQDYKGTSTFVINEQTPPVGLIQRWEKIVREVPRLADGLKATIAAQEAQIPKLEAASVGSEFSKQDELIEKRQRLAALTEALDPAKAAEASKRRAEAEQEADYVDQALTNLTATSRTASGEIDTSASPGKAGQMAEGLTGDAAAKAATENFERVIRDLFRERDTLARLTPSALADRIDQVALAINKGILKEGALFRTDNSPKYAYTDVSEIELARDQFAAELWERLNDPTADPVETAAWIEWRVNLTDHIYADGVGKTSKALAYIPLMRAGLPLPRYGKDKKAMFKYASKTPYDPNNGGESYLDEHWAKFLAYYRTLIPMQVGSPEAQALATAAASTAMPRELSLEEMERLGNEAFGSQKYQEAIAAAESLPQTLPVELQGDDADPVALEAWKQSRVYHVNGAEVRGYPEGVLATINRATAYVDGGQVRTERKAIVLLGLPGSGKSTVSSGFANLTGSAVLNGDDAKEFIPEYRNGLGSMAVHEEASAMTKHALSFFLKSGTNIILEKTGSNSRKNDKPGSIDKLIQRLKKAGYSVQLVLVDVPKALAKYQVVQRFEKTGRIVPPEYFNELQTADVYHILRQEGAADGYTHVERKTPKGAWLFRTLDAQFAGVEDAIERSSGGIASVVRYGGGESGQVGGSVGSDIESGNQGTASASRAGQWQESQDVGAGNTGPSDSGNMLPAFAPTASTPDGAFWDQIKSLDAALEGKAAAAIDAWVGGPHDSIAMGLTFGLMAPRLLENMPDAELDAMAAPVRAALRERYGDTITVYRGQLAKGTQSTGRLNKLSSYTTDRRVAERFAGAVPKARKIFSEEEIAGYEKTLAETGEVKVGRRTYRKEPGSEYVDMYDAAGDFITDTPSVRADLESENAYRQEQNAKRDEALQRVREVRIPVDAVVWATDRFNQREIIAKSGQEATFEQQDNILPRLADLRLKPEVQARIPEFYAALRAEAAKVLPENIAFKVVDELSGNGRAYRGGLDLDTNAVVISSAYGPQTNLRTLLHETAGHVLRNLYTQEEWQVLLDRAQKTGVEEALKPYLADYKRVYEGMARRRGLSGEAMRAQVNDWLDQERVAILAERWVTGTQYGTKVNSLLDRILKFIEAIRNAIRGMGLQTADDIFERVKSGEIASRGQATFDAAKVAKEVFAPKPDTAESLLDTPVGQAAVSEIAAVEVAQIAFGDAVRNALPAFAGRNAETVDLRALNRAEDLEELGAPREQIWSETGFFRGVDGQWRFEINDSGMRVRIGQGFGFERGSPVIHAELVNAYPYFDEAVTIKRDDEAKGYAEPGNIVAAGPTRKDRKSVAAHEIQHIIQQEEGYAAGGDWRIFTPEEIEAERMRLKLAQAASAQRREAPAGAAQALATARVLKPVEKMSDEDVAKELYKRLAGEVEARAVQARLNMTPEQRREKAPWESYDVPEDQQIVMDQTEREFRGSIANASETDIRSFAIPGYEGKVETVEDEDGNRIRVYRVIGKAGQSRSIPLASVVLSEQENGAWEASSYALGKGNEDAGLLAKLLDAAEAHVGVPLAATGWLSPAMMRRQSETNPAAAEGYQPAGDQAPGVMGSPKAAMLANAARENAEPAQVLDMSPAARKARAEAMGFDTSKVWYHSSLEPIDAFKPTGKFMGRWGVSGISLTDNSDMANRYLDRYGEFNYKGERFQKNVMPLYVKRNLRIKEITEPLKTDLGLGFPLPKGYVWPAELDGYDAVLVRDAINGPDLVEGSDTKLLADLDLEDTAGKVQHTRLDDPGAIVGYELILRDPSNIRSVNAAFDPAEEGSPNLLASLAEPSPKISQPGETIPAKPAVVEGGEDEEVRGLSEIIKDIKETLGMPVTQGVYGLRVRNPKTGRSWRFPFRLRGQYDKARGIARIKTVTDIEAIAHEGGHHLEVQLGKPLDEWKQKHAADLTERPAPDLDMPPIQSARGFSGLDLDADTQALLLRTARAMARHRADVEQGTQKRSAFKLGPQQAFDPDLQREAASAWAALVRRVGFKRADFMIKDLADLGLNADLYTQQAEAYVASRYSRDGQPKPRQAPALSYTDISEGFAEFFSRYLTDGQELRREQPALYEAFEDFLDAENPGLLMNLERLQLVALQQDYRKYVLASAVQRGIADVATWQDPTTWEQTKEFYRSDDKSEVLRQWLGQLSFEITNKTGPILKTQQALLRIADANGIRSPDGRPLSVLPGQDAYKIARMMAGADKIGHTYIMNGVPDYDSLETNGTSLHDALVEAMGGTSRFQWTDKAIRKFGLYLEARRAVVEWDLWAQKKQQIATTEANMEAAQEQRRTVAESRQKARGRLERAREAAIRNSTLLQDRERSLSAADTRLVNEQKRIDTLRAELEEALQAIDDGSDQAKAVRDRKQDVLARAEKKQQALLREVEALSVEVDELSVERTVLEAVIAQNEADLERLDATVGAYDEAHEEMRRELANLAKQGAQRPPTRKSKEEYAHIIAELEAANPSYSRAAQMVYDWQHALLTLEWKAGKWTDEAYQRLTERKDWYVPFMRDLDDVMPAAKGPAGNVMAKRFSESKKFTGSSRDIINPIEAMARRAYETAAAVQFNDMVKALTQLSDRVGPGGAGFIERVQKQEVMANNERTFEHLKQLAMGHGMSEDDAHALIASIDSNLDDAQVHLLWDPHNLGPNRPPIVPLWENGERKLVRLNDPVTGRRLFDAMNALGREQTSIWIKAIGYPAAALRAGVTMHPAFVLSNILGDMQAAWTLTGALPVVTQVRGAFHLLSTNPRMRRLFDMVGLPQSMVAEWYSRVGGISGGQNVAALRAMRSDYRLTELREKGYKVFNLPAMAGLGATMVAATAGGIVGGMAVGGVIGGIVGATSVGALAASAFRAVYGKGAHEAFAQLSEMSETVTRLGVAAMAYKRAKKMNPMMSDVDAAREAAFTARDVLDFDRNGAKMNTLMKIVPFLNANLQGVSSAYRKLFFMEGDRGRINMRKAALFLRWQIAGDTRAYANLSEGDRQAIRDGARVWVNIMIMSAMGAALFFLYKDDPEYDDIADEKTRATHWIFKFGGTWFRIKKPFELAAMANATEALLETYVKGDPRLGEKLWTNFKETHLPPAIPQTMRLYSDLQSGYDSQNQRPIVRQSLQRLPLHMQFDAYTSEFAKQWSAALNKIGVQVSPAKLDYALNNGIAYWGREIGVSSNYFFGRNRESPKWTDVPIAGTMYNRVTIDPARRSASVDEFWKTMGQGKGKYDQALAGYDNVLKSGNTETVKTYLAGLTQEEREYAIITKHFSKAQAEAHPLNRAKAIVSVDNTMRREMILGQLLDTSSRKAPEVMKLTPAKQTEVHDILGRISALETWNALHDLGHPGWAQREMRDPQPLLDELKAAEPRVYEEMIRRRERAKVGDYAEDRSKWSDVRARAQEMIKDEDMLGLAWRKAERKRRTPAPSLFGEQQPAQQFSDTTENAAETLQGVDQGKAYTPGPRASDMVEDRRQETVSAPAAPRERKPKQLPKASGEDIVRLPQ